jgi:nitroreductase
MIDNPVLRAMFQRKSIRRYTEQMPPHEVVTAIVRAGQHAPFAGQFGSVLLSRKKEKNPFHAPLLFTICADIQRMERIMEQRDWHWVTNDLLALLFGFQDSAYMAENMVIAAESLGLGSCFLGNAPYIADKIADDYNLPNRVFPLVQLTMGYPDENPPVRPRYPIDFTLFEDKYPVLSEEAVRSAMKEMDDGYISQEYYARANHKIPLQEGREETFTFENYGWTEHMCRKWGQWFPDTSELLDQFEKRGFHLKTEHSNGDHPHEMYAE